MKLNLHANDLNSIQAYTENSVTIQGHIYTQSIIISPEQLVPNWPVGAATGLHVADFAVLGTLEVEILLLGTGKKQVFPDAQLLVAMRQQQIGLEVMDTAAACRTFNILLSEGRRVAAALILS